MLRRVELVCRLWREVYHLSLTSSPKWRPRDWDFPTTGHTQVSNLGVLRCSHSQTRQSEKEKTQSGQHGVWTKQRGCVNLGVIHPEHLFLRSGSESEEGYHVDCSRQERGDSEGVSHCGADIRDLNVQLLPVMSDPPAAYRCVHTIERNERSVCENSIKEQADDAADTVSSG